MDIDREKEGKCLTVTVPCYNSESYLERCVESLLKERDGLEIILVDDGSTDRTGQLADQYARAYPDVVRVVHKKNGGHGSGVNAGLMLANGIYFKVVDSDDWLDEAAFHKLMSVLRFWCRTKEEKRPDLVVCNYVYDHLEEGKTKAVRYGNLFPEQKICRWDEIGCFSPEQYLVMHALIFRTGVLYDCGLKLPEHTFYVDNLFANCPLPFVQRIYYLGKEGRQRRKKLWQSLKKENPKLYRRLRLGSISGLTCLPGAPGAAVVIGGYRMARRIWQFQ